jgi:hypothetical protein
MAQPITGSPVDTEQVGGMPFNCLPLPSLFSCTSAASGSTTLAGCGSAAGAPDPDPATAAATAAATTGAGAASGTGAGTAAALEFNVGGRNWRTLVLDGLRDDDPRY